MVLLEVRASVAIYSRCPTHPLQIIYIQATKQGVKVRGRTNINTGKGAKGKGKTIGMESIVEYYLW